MILCIFEVSPGSTKFVSYIIYYAPLVGGLHASKVMVVQGFQDESSKVTKSIIGCAYAWRGYCLYMLYS